MQYFYVEYARAKRAIIIALVLLGLFLLATIILRLSVHDGHWAADLQHSSDRTSILAALALRLH